MALVPLNSWLLVKPLAEKVSAGGPGVARGEVVAVSGDIETLPVSSPGDPGGASQLAEGDTVLFPRAKAVEVTEDGVALLLVDADDLYAAVATVAE